MSTSPPAPPMPHNAEKHQLPMMTGTANHSQGATVYQQYLQVCNCYSAGAKNIFKSVSFLQFWIEPCTKRCSSFVAFCLKQFVICHHPESRFLSESYWSHAGCRDLTRASLARAFLFLPLEGKATNLSLMDSPCQDRLTRG
jgi:hypothetical protein